MLRFLIRNRLLIAVLLASTLVGAACAKFNTRGNLVVATATAHLFVDDPDASIIDRRALPQDVLTLQDRAELYGRLMTTTPVLDAIGKRAGVPGDQISGVARLTANVPNELTQPGSEERADQIRASRAPYRLELQSDPAEPVLAIYAQAPSLDAAQRLANAAGPGLHDFLVGVARRQGFPLKELPQLRQLGSARGGVVNGKAKVMIGALTFVTAFTLSLVLLLLLVRRPWRRRPEAAPERAPRLRPRLTRGAAADWPRTTRVLPWGVALLIAMFWLTPFDKIQLAFSTPVNITLDRILLPLVAVVWLIARKAGPGAAPRVRITRVHIAVLVFVAIAFLSVVVDARYLNQTGELKLAFKKLPLLLSYISIFVIVASSVRPSEVPAFMKYTLVLAVICGIEIIIEYRFKTNLFVSWSEKIFRGPFKVVLDDDSGTAFDSLGRRWIAGPAGSGVEVVTMMSMVLPIAVFGVLGAKNHKRKALYGLALAILFAAMFATQRKSSLLAPAAVMLTLLYFRRKELLSLAPLGLVIVVLVTAMSPGAIRGVVGQFVRSDNTHVATVSDRTADYDAIRPDLWTHLALGRGYGTYDHNTYRILDSEILLVGIETGVAGLAAFLMIGISVILVARKTVALRDPRWSPAALWGVAAGVCLLVVSTLYDLIGFPHGTCIFLYTAGLVTVVVARAAEDDAEAPAPLGPHHARRAHRVPRLTPGASPRGDRALV
jgi:hypothetical protein